MVQFLSTIKEAAQLLEYETMIDEAEKTEATFVKMRSSIRGTTKKSEIMIKFAWPNLLPGARTLFQGAEETLGDQLTAIRDIRWTLMAMRAEYLPSEPIGKARGKPTNLQGYLNALDD